MTLAQAAHAAIHAQSAVNLSGVVHTFSMILTEALWPEAHRLGLGTTWVNTHPISRLFVDKITDLSGGHSDFAEYSKFHDECKRLAATGS